MSRPVSYEGIEIEKEDSQNENPQCSTQNYTEIEPILADLDRWYEMRFWIPNPGGTCVNSVVEKSRIDLILE